MSNKNYTLLVVDDDEMNSDMLSRRLERQGYGVAVACSGHEALEMVRKQPFDLVLLDVMMPEMDGLEVLTILRETHSVAELPVIIVTARDQSGDVVAALHLGANDYVTKPLNFPVVLARIQTQLTLKIVREGNVANTFKPQAVPIAKSSNSPTIFFPPPEAVENNLSRMGSKSTSQKVFPDFAAASACDETTDSVHTTPVACPVLNSSDRMMVGEYEILGELGRGGMGFVYKARHLRMNRIVALKVIDKDHLPQSDSVKRFYQEIQAASQLFHPNIVMAYDAGQVRDVHYFAMEYIEGMDLARLVTQCGPLLEDQATDYIRQAAIGLQHAHERGLVHRDIKPSNLLVTWCNIANDRSKSGSLHSASLSPWPSGDATLKILDMGLALLHQQPTESSEPAQNLTCERRVIGTVDYMAPEQWMNAHTVDIRADLYSLGCTFYYLLSAQVPFPGNEPMEKMLKHHLDEPSPLERLRPGIPPRILGVIRKLMAKRPDQRYRNPAEVVEALK